MKLKPENFEILNDEDWAAPDFLLHQGRGSRRITSKSDVGTISNNLSERSSTKSKLIEY